MYLRNALLAIGLFALVAGVVLAALWVQQSSSLDGNTQAAPPVAILVAASAIPAGTLLRAEDMAWKDVREQDAPPAALRKAPGAESVFLGAVARRGFAAGEPLVAGGVVKPGERGFLAAALAPGMRAVSIGVDAASSTSGLILPGDFVDVILAQSFTEGASGRSAVGETVLQNVRVIAVDQWFATGGRPISPAGPLGTVESRIPKTITLEVDEEDAKRLLVAAQLGKVTLAMRALEGAYAIPAREPGNTEPVWATDVSSALGGGRAATRTAAPAGAPPARRPVQILRGSKSETQ